MVNSPGESAMNDFVALGGEESGLPAGVPGRPRRPIIETSAGRNTARCSGLTLYVQSVLRVSPLLAPTSCNTGTQGNRLNRCIFRRHDRRKETLARGHTPAGRGNRHIAVGALLNNATLSDGSQELTTDWVRENFKQLKLDRVVEMIETPDYVDARSVAKRKDRSEPAAPRVASALLTLWRTACKLPRQKSKSLKLDDDPPRSEAGCPPSRHGRCAFSDPMPSRS